jgi:AcrR family transcriptional regulator
LVNVFTDNVNAKAVSSGKPRGRGRPPGPTAQGREARARLYKTAIRLMTQRGYQATTLRDVAAAAGVSPGLLYRYFPSKRAVVLALYEELSAEYAARGALMPRGSWRARFRFALDASLRVLGPHRRTLSALVPVLIGDSEEGLFASATAFSRQRVLRVYLDGVNGASDAPKPAVAAPLGRLLYLVHLAVLMWWLLDKSPHQRATTALVSLIDRALALAGVALRLPPVQGIVRSGDALFREALFDDATAV